MKLNEASLDVWYNYLKEEKYKVISDRIIFLSSQDLENNEEDKTELKVLLNLEKKFLKEAKEKVVHNNKVIGKLNFYKNHLDKDHRLLAIFLDRVKNKLIMSDTPSEDMITEVYVKMMEEDMDVKGHDKLNKLFKDMMSDELEFEDLSCDNPNCIYCKSVTEEENDMAYADLVSGGYMEQINEGGLMRLMVLVNRLETELMKYTNIDCTLEFMDLDDEDDDID